MMKLQSLLLLLVCIVTLIQCKKDLQHDQPNGAIPSLPLKEFSYPKKFPSLTSNRFQSFSTFDDTRLNPAGNQLTDAGATLGRVLFYDKKLSYNNSISCGSCHNQATAFSDNAALSKGFEGQLTSRNAKTIVNVAIQSSYFWDGRVVNLEDMVLKPINNHIEMGIEKIENLDKKLAGTTYYNDLFSKAFGTPEISKEKISKALAQFLRSMVSFNSKADNINENLSSLEQQGLTLFQGKANCQSCHAGVNLRGYYEDQSFGGGRPSRSFANIGLDKVYTDQGLGAYEADKDGYFKVPSLRNVALTAPYMHDGRFKTLEEVVEHYNSGIQDHKNLSGEFRTNWDPNGLPIKLNLTDKEKESLVAFLRTLTDKTLISDEKYSDPFVN